MRKIDVEQERLYENSKINDQGIRAQQSKFYWATALGISKHEHLINKTILGKKVLEIGCSSGQAAEIYCASAKEYVGIDISDVAIEAACGRGILNAQFLCVDGHRIPFEADTFDCVIVNGLLHHLDLEQSLPEIHRVLKTTEGTLLFREPLGTNVLFQFYRLMTPRARTADERPLTFADLELLSHYYLLDKVSYFGFLSVFSAFIRLASIRALLTAVDEVIAVSPLRYMFWQVAGVARVKQLPAGVDSKLNQ